MGLSYNLSFTVKPMRITVSLIILALFMSGCSDRQNVPGSLESGNLDDITNRAESGSLESIKGMSVIPIAGWVKPTIPVVKGPTVASTWVFPRESRDGYSIRDGYWIHTVVKPFSFGVTDAMQGDSLDLKTLSNVHVDENGRVVVTRGNSSALTDQTVNAMRGMARGLSMPWVEGGQDRSVRTTVIFDNGAQRSGAQFTTPNNLPPGLINPDGSVKADPALTNALEEARRRMQPGAAPSGAPAATPGK
jgi:hypothetical protein